MGFWNKQMISWVGRALLALAVVCPAGADPVPLPREPRVPWLLQPMQPPAQLNCSDARLRLDFTRRDRPGWVWLKFTVHLANPSNESRAESLLMTAPDGGAEVSWNDKPVSQDRVTMPVSQEGGPHVVAGRVSVVRLILLGHESGTLEYHGFQPMQFSDSARSTMSVLMPLQQAWKSVHDSQLEARLAPELRMLSSDWHAAKGSDLWERSVRAYAEAPTRLTVLAETRRPVVSWLGSLGSIPALWRCWLWGVGLAWLCLSFAACAGRFWWLAGPLTYLLYGMAVRTDPVCAQWTWYEQALNYRLAIERFGWIVALLVMVGSLLARSRSGRNFKDNSIEEGVSS